MDKMNMTGSTAQWVNGIFLLATFFTVRIVIGWYMSIATFKDIFTVLRQGGVNVQHRIPTWLWGFFLAANIVLNSLNGACSFHKTISSLNSDFEATNSILVSSNDSKPSKALQAS